MAGLAGLVFALASGGRADASPYRIGAADVVDVQVWREADLSGEHRVDESGNLRHVLVGQIPAAGLTCDELADELRARLERDYLREARVIVTLSSSARRKAWVLGAIEHPGSYPVTDQTRLLDLVFAAGGAADGSDGRALLFHTGDPVSGATEGTAPAPGEEPQEVDLAALLAGQLDSNRRVAPGDVLVVSGRAAGSAAGQRPRRVRVVGEVARPGSYDLSEAPTALDAVLAAGGFTEYASANRARLVRGEGEERTEQRIRLGDIVHGKREGQNLTLQDGDLLVVPESIF